MTYREWLRRARERRPIDSRTSKASGAPFLVMGSGPPIAVPVTNENDELSADEIEWLCSMFGLDVGDFGLQPGE